MRPIHSQPAPQRGLSLVELMIGLALGLFIVAGALGIHFQHLTTTAELRLQAQLNHEMRAAMDLVTRDLRRAGHWPAAVSGTLAGGDGSPPPRNPFSTLSVMKDPRLDVAYQYQPPDDVRTAFRFQIGANGSLQMKIGDGVPQPLTDTTLMEVTGFDVNLVSTPVALPDACPSGCTGGNCPRMIVNVLDITLSGRVKRKPEITRTLRSQVRPRNEVLEGVCA